LKAIIKKPKFHKKPKIKLFQKNKYQIANQTNVLSILRNLKPPSRKLTQPSFKLKDKKYILEKNKLNENPKKIRSKYKRNQRAFSRKLKKSDIQVWKKSCLLNRMDDDASEKITFKLSDFGLCTNVKTEMPCQFGGGDFLAPEICEKGPDSSNVKIL
jgi:hypothetical protein